MKYLIISAFLLLAGCAEDKNDNTAGIINNDNASTIYDFVNNEQIVIYYIAGEYNTGTVNKDEIIKNIPIQFTNPRNEEVTVLIPETNDNLENNVMFSLNNAETVCAPDALCIINFNMLIKAQSSINNDFTLYLPVTLLNKDEMDMFIKMNAEEKYKAFAMKYLTNRIYVKFKITGNIAQ